RRSVTVEDSQKLQVAAGDVSRVRMNRGGTLVTDEDLAISVPDKAGRLTVTIENGDNPPLKNLSADAQSLERRIYFDPQGKSTLALYYGDEKLAAPAYDYARFFHAAPSAAKADLGDGRHNQSYTGRPDDRPWSERHTAILWSAMLLAVAALAVVALQGL